MPDEMSRQQKRHFERELVKSGRTLMATGIPTHPKREEMRDVAMVLKVKLTERDNAARASEAAGIAQAMNEAAHKHRPNRVAIACRKGCAYCCHNFVAAAPPEIFRLANAVRQGRAAGLTQHAVRDRCAPLNGLGPEQRLGAKLPCPLLVDGACSVYAERPLVCRQATSLLLDPCIGEFEGRSGDSERIEVSSIHLAHSSNAHVALLGALLAVGLPIEAFELSAGLDIALADPESERRWLAGDDVFKALPRNVKRATGVDMVARKIADDLTSA